MGMFTFGSPDCCAVIVFHFRNDPSALRIVPGCHLIKCFFDLFHGNFTLYYPGLSWKCNQTGRFRFHRRTLPRFSRQTPVYPPPLLKKSQDNHFNRAIWKRYSTFSHPTKWPTSWFIKLL